MAATTSVPVPTNWMIGNEKDRRLLVLMAEGEFPARDVMLRVWHPAFFLGSAPP